MTYSTQSAVKRQMRYEEGGKAMFWTDVVECADQYYLLLSDEWRRVGITWQGVSESCEMRNNPYNDPVMISVVEVARCRWGQG